MKMKAISGIMLTLLSISILSVAFNIQQVKSDWIWTETIYIRADGSFEPDTAPISTVDNITYVLTDNIVGDVPRETNAIVIERDNIVMDGAGLKVQGTRNFGSMGIYLSHRTNVTIKNVEVADFAYGIWLHYSNNSVISGNNASNNPMDGIRLHFSNNNIISDNNASSNIQHGIALIGSPNNTIAGNTVSSNFLWGGITVSNSNSTVISGNTASSNHAGIWASNSNSTVVSDNIVSNNQYGISLALHACDNNVSENNIELNDVGVYFYDASDNTFLHNNFVGNSQQIYDGSLDYPSVSPSTNTWDDGYPSGGNYWSDYSTRYPSAQELDGSGIWDTPYVIDENNQDNYPLVEPWTPAEVPPVEDTDSYIEYVNQTIQDLPDAIFTRPEEDVSNVKDDFWDLLNDTRENINEGNYEGAIVKLNEIKVLIYEEMVESAEREEIILLINDLIAYLESLL